MVRAKGYAYWVCTLTTIGVGVAGFAAGVAGFAGALAAGAEGACAATQAGADEST